MAPETLANDFAAAHLAGGEDRGRLVPDIVEPKRAPHPRHRTLRQKAEAGHITRGRCHGYDNVEVLVATGKPYHVVQQINKAEAAIVRRILTLVAEGAGFKRIAKTLNADGVAAPRRAQGWAPTAIREIVHRTLYRGEVVWNRIPKRDASGKKRYLQRPESEWAPLKVVTPAGSVALWSFSISTVAVV
jgi:hypothetical protein